MNPDIRDKIVAGIEKASRDAGAATYEEGIRVVIKMTGLFGSLLQSVSTLEELRTKLDTFSFETPFEEGAFLVAIENLSQIARMALESFTTDFAASFPPPRTGRPKEFTPSEVNEVLDFIARLHRSGNSMTIAKQRASQHYDCSKRTVERYWRNRSAPIEVKPTLADVVRLLSETFRPQSKSEGVAVIPASTVL